MSASGEQKAARWPALGALGAAVALVICCVVAPILLGAAALLALGLAIEAALVVACLLLGAIALRRHRANRCC